MQKEKVIVGRLPETARELLKRHSTVDSKKRYKRDVFKRITKKEIFDQMDLINSE